MNKVLEEMLDKYNPQNIKDKTNAIKEILQEIVLSGLSRGGFFNEAAFYGGSALRIFYKLNRFSEDLDFALINPNKDFSLDNYIPYITKELNSYGLNLDIKVKEKIKDSNITSAFLKGDTKEHILMFFPKENLDDLSYLLKDIKIKFEIDINPPKGATYELKYKLLPTPHQIQVYDEPSLFAGKIHAILCRGWKERVKGRDLFDYVFFLSKETKINLTLLENKLKESNFIKDNEVLTLDRVKEMLIDKFKSINYDNAKEDVISFIDTPSSLDMWGKDFFISITSKLDA